MSEKGGKRNGFIGKMLIFTANVVEILFLLSVWFVFTVSFFQILIKFEVLTLNRINNETAKYFLTDKILLNRVGFAVLGYCIGGVLSEWMLSRNKNKYER